MSEEVSIKHPDERMFIYIEYQSEKSHTLLRGSHELGKLVSIAQFMVECIDKLVPSPKAPTSIVIQEGAKPIETVPVPSIPDEGKAVTKEELSEREKKWREFRETIKTGTVDKEQE